MTALLCCGALAGSGCSALFVNGPPADHESRRTIDCSSNSVAPGIDAVVAGLFGLATLAALADDGGSAGILLLPTALFGASAGVGFSNTSDCREAHAALERRVELEERVRSRGPTIDDSLRRRPTPPPPTEVSPWEEPSPGWSTAPEPPQPPPAVDAGQQ